MGADGRLNAGKLEMDRDVIPMIEDLKVGWKAKISRLQAQKDEVLKEQVQLDLELRGMEDAI